MARQTDQKRKAQALADLMNGDQPAVVAARYKLNPTTVRSWKARLDLPTATGDATRVAPAFRQPAIERAQLDMADLVLNNLRAKLIATQKIAEYVTTPAWLQKQSAADVAELFETIDRAAVGILDRMAQHSRADEPPGELAWPGATETDPPAG
jgi:hypothetical protein